MLCLEMRRHQGNLIAALLYLKALYFHTDLTCGQQHRIGMQDGVIPICGKDDGTFTEDRFCARQCWPV